MSKLEDLEVERVDAVDSPATGRQFLILKSEDAGNARAEIEKAAEVVKQTTALVAKLATVDILFDKETAEQLNALAATLEVDATFKAEDTDSDTDPLGAAPQVVIDGAALTAAVKSALKDMAAEELAARDASTEDEDEVGVGSPLTKSRSKQADDNPAERKTKDNGSGLFSNVVFG